MIAISYFCSTEIKHTSTKRRLTLSGQRMKITKGKITYAQLTEIQKDHLMKWLYAKMADSMATYTAPFYLRIHHTDCRAYIRCWRAYI